MCIRWNWKASLALGLDLTDASQPRITHIASPTMPKATTPSSASKRRHNPLEADLVATGVLKNRDGRSSKRADKKQAEEQTYVDAKSSRKILAMSRDLIDEQELESAEANAPATSAFEFDPSRLEGGSDRDDDDEFANEEAWGDEEEVVEEIEVDATFQA